MVNLKNFFPEYGDEKYKYYFDLNLPLKKQIIDEKDGMYLLNVRKVYTNGLYFGVSFTQLMTTGIFHGFKCKDRGYSEKDVSSKNWFLEKWHNDINNTTFIPHEKYLEEHSIYLQDLNLPYDVYFCFDSKDNYISSNIVFSDGRVIRGLYGVSKESELEENPKEFFFKSVPTKKDIIHYVKKQATSLSNAEHTISTSYSSIIVEHSSQYEQEWSDIKRRKT